MNSVIDKCRLIQAKSHDLADEFFALGSELSRFAGVLNLTEVPQISHIYDKLATIVLKNGDFIL